MIRPTLFGILLALSAACGSSNPSDLQPPPSTPLVNEQVIAPKVQAVLSAPTGTCYLPVRAIVEPLDPDQLPKDVFAMINGKPLADDTIDKRLKMYPDIPPEQRDTARQHVGETLIAEQLIDVSLSSGQIVIAKEDLARSLERFNEMLEKSEMDRAAYMERSKLNEAQLERMFKVEALFWSQVSDEGKAEEYAKIKDQLEEARTVDLLLKGGRGIQEDEKPRLKEEIDKLRDRALKGEDFVELALAHSDDPHVQQSRGRLGPLVRSSLREDLKIMTDAIFLLEKTGDISEVIETPLGYMLIKLAELTPETFTIPGNQMSPPRTVPVDEYCEGVIYSKARNEFFKALFDNNVIVRHAPPEPPAGLPTPAGNN